MIYLYLFFTKTEEKTKEETKILLLVGFVDMK